MVSPGAGRKPAGYVTRKPPILFLSNFTGPGIRVSAQFLNQEGLFEHGSQGSLPKLSEGAIHVLLLTRRQMNL